jgi:sulfate transport system permease protein
MLEAKGPLKTRFVQKSILPGFGLTMGFTLLYLSIIVLIPLSAVALKATGAGWAELWGAISSERVLASFRVTLLASLAAAVVNVVFGFLVAWVLTRYSFPGKRFVDGLIDLPFALPTAVAGISLTAIYSQNGWIGQWLEPLGIKVAFTPIGITVALIFIGLPFVVRTVQPVIGELEKEIEKRPSLSARSAGSRSARCCSPSCCRRLLPASRSRSPVRSGNTAPSSSSRATCR